MNDQNLIQVLPLIQGGALLEDASDKLRELLTAVTEQGKGGSLTITLKAKPAAIDGNGIVRQVELTGEAKPTMPKRTASTVLWIDDEHRLLNRDPRQPDLPIMVDRPRSATPTATPQAANQ